MLLEMSKLVGVEVSLIEMLDCREKRSIKQKDLLTNYPESTLLSMTMNIPGPVKTNEYIVSYFNEMLNKINTCISEKERLYQLTNYPNTGPEHYLLTTLSPVVLKERMKELEESSKGARLFDLDVLYQEKAEIKTISRQDLGYAPRSCLLCEKDAKVCGRQRTHSVADLQAEIFSLLQKGIER